MQKSFQDKAEEKFGKPADASRCETKAEVRKLVERAITVSLSPGLTHCTIGFVQQLEKDLDQVLGSNGFTRTGGSFEGGVVKFDYVQKT